MMNQIAISCDIGIFPLPLDNSMNFWKPENKLIHMWRMALPTITSPIPSYEMAFTGSGKELCPKDEDSWRENILELSNSKSLRRSYGLIGHSHASQAYDDKSIDQKWHDCLLSL